MIWVRIFVVGICSLVSVGCAFTARKSEATSESLPKPPPGKDTSIQALLERLRVAVRKRDGAALAAEMTADFGYRWDALPQGEDFFSYWNEKQLWGELERLLGGRLVAKENYLVGPPEFVMDSSYRGPRVGFRVEEQRWKFAYFLEADVPQP